MERTIQSMKEQRKYENEFNVELKRDEHGQTKWVTDNRKVKRGQYKVASPLIQKFLKKKNNYPCGYLLSK